VARGHVRAGNGGRCLIRAGHPGDGGPSEHDLRQEWWKLGKTAARCTASAPARGHVRAGNGGRCLIRAGHPGDGGPSEHDLRQEWWKLGKTGFPPRLGALARGQPPHRREARAETRRRQGGPGARGNSVTRSPPCEAAARMVAPFTQRVRARKPAGGARGNSVTRSPPCEAAARMVAPFTRCLWLSSAAWRLGARSAPFTRGLSSAAWRLGARSASARARSSRRDSETPRRARSAWKQRHAQPSVRGGGKNGGTFHPPRPRAGRARLRASGGAAWRAPREEGGLLRAGRGSSR
jgi:hypothetical protein